MKQTKRLDAAEDKISCGRGFPQNCGQTRFETKTRLNASNVSPGTRFRTKLHPDAFEINLRLDAVR